jgi:hypothetical protein
MVIHYSNGRTAQDGQTLPSSSVFSFPSPPHPPSLHQPPAGSSFEFHFLIPTCVHSLLLLPLLFSLAEVRIRTGSYFR